MKIILLQDVPKIGKKYDEKDVAEGYATNMLIPRGLAEHATPGAKKKAEAARKANETATKLAEEALVAQLKAIDGMNIKIKAKANEKGHLFAEIHNEEIAKALSEKTSATFPAGVLEEKHVKQVGPHDIEVNVNGKTAKFTVIVEAL